MRTYIEFTGEETELEYLRKCLEQWEASSKSEPIIAMMELGSMFSDMKHRVDELEE